jgi:hypothetical protein
MAGKVTDPGLLAALDAPDERPDSRRVADPAVLAALNGPGAVEATGRGLGQGASFGFGDEIQGLRRAAGRSGLPGLVALGAAGMLPDPETIREMAERAGGQTTGQQIVTGIRGLRRDPSLSGLVRGDAPESFGSDYRRGRDEDREANRAARDAHPRWSLAGEIGGGLVNPLSWLAAPVKGATLLPRVVQGMKAAGALGAASGAGASEAGTLSGLAGDTALGAAAGGVVGGALPAAGEGLRRGAARLASAAGDKMVELGRKALSGVGTPLAARKPISEGAVRQAVEEGAIRPLSTIKGIESRLMDLAEKHGADYGAILAELERAGVKGPNAVLLARRLADEAAAAKSTSLGSARPAMLLRASRELPSKVSDVPFADKRLGLMQAEQIKRGLQQEARKEYDKIARQMTTAGETKMELAGHMRRGIEDAIEEQASKAPEAAAAFRPVKAREARTLEALRAAEEGAARAARRKPFSLSSTVAGAGFAGATGSPLLGLLGAIGHGVVDSRLASTGAWSAAQAEKALGALARGLSASDRAALERALASRAGSAELRWPFGLSPAAADEDPQK